MRAQGAVDRKSAKQSIFATSSAEAEYIVAFDASKEAVWVRKFIYGLGVVLTIEKPINMYCDNTGAIAIANESGITKGARHFRAKVHYLREVIEFGDIKLEKVHTDDNLADPFTKALAFPKHSELTRNIGMLPASSFMEYTPPVTYPKEVEETLGTPIEIEPLDETPLEDLGLNTCNHDIPLSSREIPNFDEPEPQPQPLPSCLSLDISLGEKRGPKPLIKPHSPDSLRMKVASDDLRDALSVIFGLSELKLLEQAPRSLEYVPDPIELEDHVPVYIPEPEHPEDLGPAEDEAPTPPLPPFFLSPRIRPPRTRAAMAQMRATEPSTYHSLLPSGTPPLLPIPLPAPSTSRKADIPKADTPSRKRLLTTPRPSCESGQPEGQLQVGCCSKDEFRILLTDIMIPGRIVQFVRAEIEGIEESTQFTPAQQQQPQLLWRHNIQALIDQELLLHMAEAEASRDRNGL
ncbi:hypothetical protein Tco_0840899 [Tanacetum coccineum]|uniref:Uncharacterized protein n=1 Tax=Tanacetum coccineum TaxID=301880 RepID=A0ABQ5AX87_9ASTR